jgi:hypothetical protein
MQLQLDPPVDAHRFNLRQVLRTRPEGQPI